MEQVNKGQQQIAYFWIVPDDSQGELWNLLLIP